MITSIIGALIDMLQREDIVLDLAIVVKYLKDGNPQEAYRQLQLIIAKPELDPEVRAELCNTSASLGVRIINVNSSGGTQ